jgi:hypothetical protein
MQGEKFSNPRPGGFDRLSHPVGWILDARNWMLDTGKNRIANSEHRKAKSSLHIRHSLLGLQ